MLSTAANLQRASRVGDVVGTSSRVTWIEFAVLVACGAAAALAVFAIHMSLRIPGHAILRAVFPMAAGLAIVPRRMSGLVMTLAAAATGAVLHLRGYGEIQPAALAGLLALGPVLDIATLGATVGWRLYVRFVAAGVAANLISFATRAVLLSMGYVTPGSRQMEKLGWIVPVSFVLCGAVAGLVSAVVWFRARAK